MNLQKPDLKSAQAYGIAAVIVSCLLLQLALPGARAQTKTAAAVKERTYATPEEAVDALVDAAEKYDQKALGEILGPGSHDIVDTGEPARDKETAGKFVTEYREKHSITKDTKNPNRATLIIGDEDWPFPVPIVHRLGKWSFDSPAGLREILLRRVGRNELDAIEICHGYVEAQHEYALIKRGTFGTNQYAQRIISTPGKQDGLAWQNPDGTWSGPIGENVAKAIVRGYTNRNEPYHGYFFKILKGQGPAAPLGELDYVVKGAMIGGFALIAAPAQYRVTGVKTFMVSNDGVVYEKDLGPNTLELAKKIERFNPDNSWTPVAEQ